jgi:uncharacterized protein with NAD-binding domain and iron-sulfur cluster
MAGLVTAWELTHGDWQDHVESVTVIQRGHRLGGKGASSRGVHDRIEEHGLHVLLGYYDATFRVMRQVYAELDRERSDPTCPIRSWWDAVAPAGDVGLVDRGSDGWAPFVTRFSRNDDLPGEPGAEDRPLQPVQVLARAVQLLLDFHRSLADPPKRAPQLTLRTSPGPWSPAGSRPWVVAAVRGGALTLLAGLLEAAGQAARLGSALRVDATTSTTLAAALRRWLADARAAALGDPQARRIWQLVDLVTATVVGMLVDGVLTEDAARRLDDLDFRAWLARHGAASQTLDSPIVRGMYDLVFAYADGDRARPQFAAGLGLQLGGRMLFDFKGSIFWRMNAGMGEVVFAPLHQALRRRGVQLRYFRRLDRLDTDGRRVTAIDLTRQADLLPGRGAYDPLVRVGGLPAWPERPLLDQLVEDPGAGLEQHGSVRGTGHERLVAGRDFDIAVLAVSLGMVPHVAPALVAANPAWQRMVTQVRTVATRAAQLWLTVDDAALGWPGPAGVTLSGFGDTFDTWASMSHLLPLEGWPVGAAPRGLAYLCSVLPEHTSRDPDATAAVRADLETFLTDDVAALWPAAVDDGGFRWDLLVDPAGRVGPARLAAQLVRANTDPSDRYVQSVPGSGRHRLPPDGSGYDNLALAGDWTACGLDAGCLEAATRSGVLAARAVLDGAVGSRGVADRAGDVA